MGVSPAAPRRSPHTRFPSWGLGSPKRPDYTPAACSKGGLSVVDRTKKVQAAIAQEQKLSDEGRTPFRFQLEALQPTVTIGGKVSIEKGTATADLRLVDPATGATIKHIVARDRSGDLDAFLERLGT